MTLATLLTPADFGTLVDEAFASETPLVSSSESALGQDLEHFTSAAAIKDKVAQCAAAGLHDYAFAFWYPAMKGLRIERRVDLDPPRDGHRFRHSLGGWGLIHLHLYFGAGGRLQCRVAVNSQTRALTREARYPELGPVADWDWRVVETTAFRLSRRLAAMGPTEPVNPTATAEAAPAPRPSPRPAPRKNPWKR